MKFRFAGALALTLALAPFAVAQTPGGTLTGAVRDEQGAAVPGSEVTARGSDATFRFTSTAEGTFRFLDLPPGPYTLSAVLSGFQPASRDVIVAVGKTVVAPLDLRIAPVAESVTVSAAAPIVDRHADRHLDHVFDRRADERFRRRAIRSRCCARCPACWSIASTSAATKPASSRTSCRRARGRRTRSGRWTASSSPTWPLPACRRPISTSTTSRKSRSSTAGQDIKQQTGGVGINLVTRRGTNQFHGGVARLLRQRRDGGVERAGRAAAATR